MEDALRPPRGDDDEEERDQMGELVLPASFERPEPRGGPVPAQHEVKEEAKTEVKRAGVDARKRDKLA